MDEVGINVNVDIHNARHALKQYAPDLEKALKQTFKKYADRGAQYARAGAPRRTGALADSFEGRTKMTKNMTRLQVTSTGSRGVPKYRYPQDVGRHSGPSAMSGTQYLTNAWNRVVPEAVNGILREMDRVGDEFEKRANGG